MPDQYALDTNVYIAALRHPGRLERLTRYVRRAGPRLRLHSVVALELRAGAHRQEQIAAVDDMVAEYATRERVIVPSFEAFAQAGRVLAALSVYERFVQGDWGSALTIDVVIATSCREADAVLLTENVRHFAAIQRHLRGFRFVDATAAIE